MRGCSLNGISSPYLSRARASFARIVGVCSQWVATSRGALAKMPSSVRSSSTSMLPVLEPMNTLMPHARCRSTAFTASRLSLVAPR